MPFQPERCLSKQPKEHVHHAVLAYQSDAGLLSCLAQRGRQLPEANGCTCCGDIGLFAFPGNSKQTWKLKTTSFCMNERMLSWFQMEIRGRQIHLGQRFPPRLATCPRSMFACFDWPNGVRCKMGIAAFQASNPSGILVGDILRT